MDADARDFLDVVGKIEVPLYRSMVKKAIGLGYKVRKDKTKNPSYSLSSTRYGTILRLIYDGKKAYIRLKFYGASDYSPVFDRALKRTIEEHDFRYTGCYGCGSCTGKRRGYMIRYDDGRKYFRCGRELIEVMEINREVVTEIERLMESHTQYARKCLRQNLRRPSNRTVGNSEST